MIRTNFMISRGQTHHKIEKTNQADFWCKRRLTLFGRVYIIITYLISKLVYPASMLKMPDI